MIISSNFIWLHIGKAAGTSTRNMFYILKGILDSSIEMNDNMFLKHDSISKRCNKYEENFKYSELHLNNLDKILNIRRLPSYILSRCEHALKSHNVEYTKDHMLRGLTEGKNVKMYEADNVLRFYLEDTAPTHWIRSEHVNEDFIKVMRNYYDINTKLENRLLTIEKNVNNNYNKKLLDTFTKEEIEIIYSKCPLWASYEKKIYGNLLI